MAQAEIINIGKPRSNPATPTDPEVAARKLKFASAFQGMDSDLRDLLQAARLASLCLETKLSGGLDQVQTDEDGRRYLVVAMDDVEMVQFAGFELSDRVKRIHETYQRVFEIA